MYSIFTVVAFLLVVLVAEVFFGGPAIVQGLFDRAERLPRGIFRSLVLYPLAIVATGYALATLVGIFVGFSAAWADVGQLFALIFLGGIVGSFFSFVGDVGSIGKSAITGKERGAKPGVRMLSSLIFIAGMYGSLVVAVLKINGVLDGLI